LYVCYSVRGVKTEPKAPYTPATMSKQRSTLSKEPFDL